jgi:hypothetical protein
VGFCVGTLRFAHPTFATLPLLPLPIQCGAYGANISPCALHISLNRAQACQFSHIAVHTRETELISPVN